MVTNAVEFVPNEHCDCCGPDYTLQFDDEKFNIYQADRSPVYSDGNPEVTVR